MTAQLDDLRRRLYRADATEEDVRRYLDERGAEVPTEPAPPPPSVRRRRLLPVGVVAAVLAVAVVATGALLHRPAAPPVARTTERAAVSQVSGPTRSVFELDGTETAAERFEGVGDAVVRVTLPSAESGTQRAAVVLYSSRTSTISWRALRRMSRGDATTYRVVAMDRLTSHVDFATPNPFTYAGAPPTAVVVSAPADLHWTLLVAAASGPPPQLH